VNHNTKVNGVQVNNRMQVTDRTDTSGTRRVRFLTARRRLWLAGLGALAVLALLAVVSLRDGSGYSPHPGVPQTLAAGAGSNPTTQARLDARRRIAGDPLALGPVAAPVVVSEWGDFQCPFCRAFDQDTQPALIGWYVDSGQVRFEWHDLAKIGPESVLAARAARAAARQGAFWPFHDTLYREQSPENSGALTQESLTAMARGLGLDTGRFSRDVTSVECSIGGDASRSISEVARCAHLPRAEQQTYVLCGTRIGAWLGSP
jgi:protein-disulfide isomerase